MEKVGNAPAGTRIWTQRCAGRSSLNTFYLKLFLQAEQPEQQSSSLSLPNSCPPSWLTAHAITAQAAGCDAHCSTAPPALPSHQLDAHLHGEPQNTFSCWPSQHSHSSLQSSPLPSADLR